MNARLPLIGLLAIQILIGYEWFMSGLNSAGTWLALRRERQALMLKTAQGVPGASPASQT